MPTDMTAMTDDQIIARAQSIIQARNAANLTAGTPIAPPLPVTPPALPIIHSQHHFDVGKILALVTVGVAVAGGVYANPAGFGLSLLENPQNLTSLIAGIMHIIKPELPFSPEQQSGPSPAVPTVP